MFWETGRNPAEITRAEINIIKDRRGQELKAMTRPGLVILAGMAQLGIAAELIRTDHDWPGIGLAAAGLVAIAGSGRRLSKLWPWVAMYNQRLAREEQRLKMELKLTSGQR